MPGKLCRHLVFLQLIKFLQGFHINAHCRFQAAHRLYLIRAVAVPVSFRHLGLLPIKIQSGAEAHRIWNLSGICPSAHHIRFFPVFHHFLICLCKTGDKRCILIHVRRWIILISADGKPVFSGFISQLLQDISCFCCNRISDIHLKNNPCLLYTSPSPRD